MSSTEPWSLAPLSELGREVRQSFRPQPGTRYELFSVPTFPTGQPEVLDGKDIGSSKRTVQTGDVLICKINPRINRVWTVPEPLGVGPQIASSEYLVFRPGSRVLSRFLMWYLRSPVFRDWIKMSVEGATGSHTRAKSGPILRQLVPVPPLHEQRRIVAAIEEQFSRLNSAEMSIRAARRKSDAFEASSIGAYLRGSWERTTLGTLASRITKGTTPTSLGFQFLDRGVRFAKVESLVDGRISHDRCAFISADADAALARSRLAAGDVLVSIAGTLGRVARVTDEDIPANTNQAVAIVRPRDSHLTRYLVAWLEGPLAQHYFRTGGRGVGLQNLNLKQIAATPVALPPARELERVTANVERLRTDVDALGRAVKAMLIRTAMLRSVVLRDAFAGRLATRNSAVAEREAIA